VTQPRIRRKIQDKLFIQLRGGEKKTPQRNSRSSPGKKSGEIKTEPSGAGASTRGREDGTPKRPKFGREKQKGREKGKKKTSPKKEKETTEDKKTNRERGMVSGNKKKKRCAVPEKPGGEKPARGKKTAQRWGSVKGDGALPEGGQCRQESRECVLWAKEKRGFRVNKKSTRSGRPDGLLCGGPRTSESSARRGECHAGAGGKRPAHPPLARGSLRGEKSCARPREPARKTSNARGEKVGGVPSGCLQLRNAEKLMKEPKNKSASRKICLTARSKGEWRLGEPTRKGRLLRELRRKKLKRGTRATILESEE